MPKATITKTSADSAVVDPFVLREGATTRLVFKPQIVNNTADANKPVKGELLWQRRKRSEQDEEWEDGAVWRLDAVIVLTMLCSGLQLVGGILSHTESSSPNLSDGNAFAMDHC